VCQNTQERDDWVRIISAICKCPIEESKTEWGNNTWVGSREFYSHP
jgi:hypothetical protein